MKKVAFALVTAMTLVFSAQAKDIVDTAIETGYFETLTKALDEAGLVDTLRGKGPFTLFAPNEEAFAKIPQADLEALLKDKAKLTAVLTYHLVAGKIMAVDITAGKVRTVQGSDLTIVSNYGIQVDKANITIVDIKADNGVIHVIDAVVIPK